MATKGEQRRPRNANGNGGARQRSNGSWEWRHTLSDGRRFSGYGKTQAQAKQSCMDKVRQAEKGLDPKKARQSVSEYLEWWLAEIVAPNRAPKTTRAYTDTVRRHLIPELGKHELGKLNGQHVTSLLNKKREAGLSGRSLAMIREVLRGALNVAIKMSIIERNAAALATPPKQQKVDRRTISPEEAKRLLAAFEGDRLEALYRLALTLGMRQAEIIGLRWQDVDLDAGVLHVRQTIQRIGDQVHVGQPKTVRSRRTLPLAKPLVAALKAHKDKQAFERAKAGKFWTETGLVFTSTVGTALDARNVSRDFKRFLAAAELPTELRFYDMRHAAASLLIADGMAITDVADMLGHALTSTTLNVYAHAMPGSNRRVAEAMERILG